MVSTLDNPVWHSLTTAQRDFGEWSSDRAVCHYPRDVATFCGVESLHADTWERLKAYFGHRAVVTIRADKNVAPFGWKDLYIEPLTQYVADTPDPDPELEVVELGANNVDEMMALTQATEPGPFLARTHELGHYIGVRRDGALVAMAGERMRTDTYSEISAVCVAESARRQGLAAALTTTLVHEIRGRGIEAILHVADGNDPAHELYQRIGFRKRTELMVGVWRWIGEG